MTWHHEDDERPEGACLDGEHDLYKRPRDGNRVCKHCGVSSQTLYGAPKSAQTGDLRVVCRDPDCGFGPHTDANGHGYVNHTTMALARAALVGHQRAVGDEDDPDTWHDASIQQHPVPAIVGPD